MDQYNRSHQAVREVLQQHMRDFCAAKELEPQPMTSLDNITEQVPPHTAMHLSVYGSNGLQIFSPSAFLAEEKASSLMLNCDTYTGLDTPPADSIGMISSVSATSTTSAGSDWGTLHLDPAGMTAMWNALWMPSAHAGLGFANLPGLTLSLLDLGPAPPLSSAIASTTDQGDSVMTTDAKDLANDNAITWTIQEPNKPQHVKGRAEFTADMLTPRAADEFDYGLVVEALKDSGSGILVTPWAQKKGGTFAERGKEFVACFKESYKIDTVIRHISPWIFLSVELRYGRRSPSANPTIDLPCTDAPIFLVAQPRMSWDPKSRRLCQ
ncbi:hypothetical protein V8E36_009139 [Tilletia maclaganii]